MSGKVFLSIGDGVDIGINEQDRLIVTKKLDQNLYVDIDLGLATDSRFAELMTYMQRLRANAIDDRPMKS